MPVRGRHPLAAGVLAVLALTSCGLLPPSTEQTRRQEALQQRQAEARERCQQRWQQLQQPLARYREQRRQLLAVEAESYIPGPGRPRPIDPEDHRRLAPYDQEIEEEQYRQDLEAWQQLERERRGVWREAHGLRLDRARSAFDQALSRLRRLEPRAVDGAAPLQLNETVLNGLQRCDQAP
jgi:hypothetical protein